MAERPVCTTLDASVCNALRGAGPYADTVGGHSSARPGTQEPTHNGWSATTAGTGRGRRVRGTRAGSRSTSLHGATDGATLMV